MNRDPGKLINQAPNEARLINTVLPLDYLKELSIRLHRSHRPAEEVFTPQELQHWRELGPWEINRRLTGDPLTPPEWRTNLVEFDDEERIENFEDVPEALDQPGVNPEGLPLAPQDPVTQGHGPGPPGSNNHHPTTAPEVKSKGFKRGIINLSKRIRTTAAKLAHRPKDRNNNPESHSRFYADLGPRENWVSPASGSAFSS